jgi:hypothetical protein
MYAWMWRRLPGSWATKLVGMLLLLLGVLALLFLVVFPRVGPALPFNHVTVDTPTQSPAPISSEGDMR